MPGPDVGHEELEKMIRNEQKEQEELLEEALAFDRKLLDGARVNLRQARIALEKVDAPFEARRKALDLEQREANRLERMRVEVAQHLAENFHDLVASKEQSVLRSRLEDQVRDEEAGVPDAG